MKYDHTTDSDTAVSAMCTPSDARTLHTQGSTRSRQGGTLDSGLRGRMRRQWWASILSRIGGKHTCTITRPSREESVSGCLVERISRTRVLHKCSTLLSVTTLLISVARFLSLPSQAYGRELYSGRRRRAISLTYDYTIVDRGLCEDHSARMQISLQ